MFVKEKQLIQIRISDSYGFNEKVFPDIKKLIEKLNPNYYAFLSPNSFVVFLSINFNAAKIDRFISESKDICKQHSEHLENTSLSKCIATFTYETNLFGKIKNIPMGSNEIYKDKNKIWNLP